MNPELASEIDRPRIIKTHEETPQPYPNIIYVVRDGRDVAISYHAFLIRNGTLSEDVTLEDFLPALCEGAYDYGAWNTHVTNWLDAHDDALVVRYEDMLENGAHQLRRVLEFMGRSIERERLVKAAEASQFDRLHKREKRQKKQNKEANLDEEKLFFRKGEKRQYETKFSEEMNSFFSSTTVRPYAEWGTWRTDL